MSKTASANETSLINKKFKADKEFTLKVGAEYLQTEKEAINITAEILLVYRQEINKFVENGDFTLALGALEKLREAKTGIVLTKKDGIDGASSVLIRDARNAKSKSVRETEAFEMQYLNAIRAAIDIAIIENKPQLEANLKTKAKEFIVNFSVNNVTNSQKELAKLLKKEIKEIGKFMEKVGVADIYNKLNVAKDFQNFNDIHSNIFTISSIKHDGINHTAIEAEIAMKGLTKIQNAQYAAISQESAIKPQWFNKMPKCQQALTKKYAPIITASTHVIPTQLRQIAGMKNAFEKITAIHFSNKPLEILYASKHAGTLASFAKDKKSRQEITNENARQAQEWLGNSKLHCNTLNSAGFFGAGDDPEIVKSTQTAMKIVKGKETNTSFNNARFFGSSNDLSGAKATLKEVADFLVNKEEFKNIKDYLELPERGIMSKIEDIFNLPRIISRIKDVFKTSNQSLQNRMKRIFVPDSPKNKAEKEIERLFAAKKIGDKEAEILKSSIKLKPLVQQADSLLRFGDAENVSLQASTELNFLTYKLQNIDRFEGSIFAKFPTSEMLTMCASGKDRTGLSMHDQSAQVIANKIGMEVNDIDSQLLAGGHTAQQAGGIHAGGATIGCFGTKSENKAGIPKSRKEGLLVIVEVTAQSNKIKAPSKLFSFFKKKTKQQDHGNQGLAGLVDIEIQTISKTLKTPLIKEADTLLLMEVSTIKKNLGSSLATQAEKSIVESLANRKSSSQSTLDM